MYPLNTPPLAPAFSQDMPQMSQPGSGQQAISGMKVSKAPPHHHHSHGLAELPYDAPIIPLPDSPGVPGQQDALLKNMYSLSPELQQPATPPHQVPDPSGAAWSPQQQSPTWSHGSPAPQGHHGHQDHQPLEDLETHFMDCSLSQQNSQDPQVNPAVPLGQQTPGAPRPSQRDHLVPQESWPVAPVCQVPQVGPPALSSGGQGSVPSPAGSKHGRRASARPRRQKLYECGRFTDPLLEKRRQDAINSKKNRELRKNSMEEMRTRVKSATELRDRLRQEVDALKQREAHLLAQLQALPNSLPCPLPLTYPDTQSFPTSLSPVYTLPDTFQPTTTSPAYALPNAYTDTFQPTTTMTTATMPQTLPGTTIMTGATSVPTTLTTAATMQQTLPGTTIMTGVTSVSTTLPTAATMQQTLPGTTTMTGATSLPTSTLQHTHSGSSMSNTQPNTNTLPPIYTLPAFSALGQDAQDPYNMNTQTYPGDRW